MATDPVCGMTVKPDSPHRYAYRGIEYHFCSAKCLTKFQASPQDYARPLTTPPAVAASGTTYTCPMHPEIRQSAPGNCPKCGMALEPETPVMKEAVEYTCPMHPE